MKKYLLLICLLLFITASALWHTRERPVSTGAPQIYWEFFPQAHVCDERLSPFPHILAHTSQKTLLGYVIFSADLDLGVTGYAGPTPLALALDTQGKIINLKALPNNETYSYTGRTEQFLKQFLGASDKTPLEIGRDVDAITQATITSEALNTTIRKTLQRFSREILDQPAPPLVKTSAPARDKIIIPLALLLSALTALFIRNRVLRWITMLGGFIYFGLITHTMLSIIQIANISLGRIPDLAANPLWFMILGISLGSCLLIGRIYCGALCPFALLQEILNKTVRRPSPPSSRFHRRTRTIKYVLLVLLLGICSLTGNARPAEMEPFVTLFAGQGTKLAWGLTGLMLIAGIFYFRFWCAYLCPVGALTSLLAKASLFKIRQRSPCANCGTCLFLCPTKAIERASPDRIKVNEAECILCGKCLQGCPEKNLNLMIACHERK